LRSGFVIDSQRPLADGIYLSKQAEHIVVGTINRTATNLPAPAGTLAQLYTRFEASHGYKTPLAQFRGHDRPPSNCSGVQPTLNGLIASEPMKQYQWLQQRLTRTQ
jgi:hypothetical protein